MSIRLTECARSGTIQHRWNTEFRVMPGIGVQRDTVFPNGNPKKALAVLLQRPRQALGAWQRFQRQRQHDPPDLHMNAAMVAGRPLNELTQLGFRLRRILFGNDSPVDAKRDPIRHYVRIDAT